MRINNLLLTITLSITSLILVACDATEEGKGTPITIEPVIDAPLVNSGSVPKEVFKDAGNDRVPLYRLFNPNSGEHLYTQDNGEYIRLGSLGWKQEEISFYSVDNQTTLGSSTALPWLRVYNPNNGLHHWTTDRTEYDALGRLGWKKESGSGFIFDTQVAKSVPLYRLYNRFNGTHHWTMDANEQSTLVALGWKDEGIAGYVYKESESQTAHTEYITLDMVQNPKELTVTLEAGFHEITLESTEPVNWAGEYHTIYIQGNEPLYDESGLETNAAGRVGISAEVTLDTNVFWARESGEYTFTIYSSLYDGNQNQNVTFRITFDTATVLASDSTKYITVNYYGNDLLGNEDAHSKFNLPASDGSSQIVIYKFADTKEVTVYPDSPWEFIPFSDQDRAYTRSLLEDVSRISGLSFMELPVGSNLTPQIIFQGREGGGGVSNGLVVQIGLSEAMIPGTKSYQTLLHEIGHSFGLSHTWEDRYEGHLKMPDEFDNPYYAVTSYSEPMNFYQSFFGQVDKLALKLLYGSEVDIVSYIENDKVVIQGTDLSDKVSGTENYDEIFGGAGDDYIFANIGNDVIFGGAGDDSIFGQRGDDKMSGGAGNDLIDGGDGTDLAVFTESLADWMFSGGKVDSNGRPYFEGQGPNNQIDKFFGIERLKFSDVELDVESFIVNYVPLPEWEYN